MLSRVKAAGLVPSRSPQGDGALPVRTPEMRRAQRDSIRAKKEKIEHSIESGPDRAKRLIRKGRIKPADWCVALGDFRRGGESFLNEFVVFFSPRRYDWEPTQSDSLHKRLSEIERRKRNRGVSAMDERIPLPDIAVSSKSWDMVSEMIICDIVKRKDAVVSAQRKANVRLCNCLSGLIRLALTPAFVNFTFAEGNFKVAERSQCSPARSYAPRARSRGPFQQIDVAEAKKAS